jgi:ankyrin repeat protein
MGSVSSVEFSAHPCNKCRLFLDGTLSGVKSFVDSGGEINKKCCYGYTPLYCATLNMKLDIVKYLLEKGVDVNVVDCRIFSPLYIASMNGYKKITKLLIKAGADINRRHNCGNNAVYASYVNKHYSVVKLLIKAGADIDAMKDLKDMKQIIEEIVEEDKIIWSPRTHKLYSEKKKKKVVFLLQFTVKNTQLDKHFYFSVICIIQINPILNFCYKFMSDHCCDICGLCLSGDLSGVKAFPENGGNVNRGECPYKHTPIYYAVWGEKLDLVNFLLEKKADINIADVTGWTPLQLASLMGYTKIVKTLIKAGANINKLHRSRITPMYSAFLGGHHKVMKLLIKGGANMELIKETDLVKKIIEEIDRVWTPGNHKFYSKKKKGRITAILKLMKKESQLKRLPKEIVFIICKFSIG